MYNKLAGTVSGARLVYVCFLICLSHHLQHEREGEPDEAGYD